MRTMVVDAWPLLEGIKGCSVCTIVGGAAPMVWAI